MFKPRYLMYIGLACMIFGLYVMSTQIKAAPYTSPPQSLDTTFFAFQGPVSAVLWQQKDGSWFCLAGKWANVINYVNTWPKEQPRESTSAYMMRAVSQIASREQDIAEQLVCNVLRIDNIVAEVWLSRQNFRCGSARDELCETNLVYRIIDVDGVQTVDRSDKIGRIPHSTVCGDEIFSGTRSVYREVPVQYQNAPVNGATICRKQ